MGTSGTARRSGRKAGRLLIRPAFFLLLASSAAAETRFVYPDLDLPVRRGAGRVYKIIKLVKDGDQVEQLEARGEWAKIRLADGTEGWIEQKLLTADRPSPQRLESLKQENSQLQQKVGELEKDINELNMGMAAMKEHQPLSEAIEKTSSCEAQMDALRAERRAEEDADIAKRFATVTGVFLIGWLLGRISSRAKRTPRRLQQL